MTYLEVLSKCHVAFNPKSYVEIGVGLGSGLQLSKCRSIGIDPACDKNISVGNHVTLYKCTSDTFFETHDLSELLEGHFDMAFIGGTQLTEFALRDFMNLEAHAHTGSIIIIADRLSRQVESTDRDRNTRTRSGPVYQLASIFKRYRPDLEVTIFDVDNQGMAVVGCLNKFSNVLKSKYDEIIQDIEKEIDQETSFQAHHRTWSPLPENAVDTFINQYQLDLARRKYLSLLKDTLINHIYADFDLRVAYINELLDNKRTFDRNEFLNITLALPKEYKKLLAFKQEGLFYKSKIQNAGFAHSMIGAKRMNALIATLDIVRMNQIPGDLVECGVWRGGSSIMLAAYNDVYGLNRNVYVADSFDGLPSSSMEQDENLDLSKVEFPELAIPLDVVKHNFRKYNLLSSNVIFIKGWFKDTLPHLKGKNRIALLRLDGDLYESTRDILVNLYDNVVQGGILYVDDWGIPNCKNAVLDFYKERKLEMPEYVKIDWTGIYWIKQ